VRELQAAMAGAIGFTEAIALAKTASRQYAKRQATWFRHQLGSEWQRIASPEELTRRDFQA
jgi:tRNA dimethylallyltransferase